jgi:hypothetical protein
VLVDRLYDLRGSTLWYEPYDYRADGVVRLKRSVDEKQPTALNRSAGAFLELESIIGRRGFIKLLPALSEATQARSAGSAPAIEQALTSTFPDKAGALRTWWSRSSAVLLGP